MNDKLNDLIAFEEWNSFDQEKKEWLTFRYFQKVDNRLKNLEKRKRLDTGISAFAGGVGGFIAFFTARIFKLFSP